MVPQEGAWSVRDLNEAVSRAGDVWIQFPPRGEASPLNRALALATETTDGVVAIVQWPSSSAGDKTITRIVETLPVFLRLCLFNPEGFGWVLIKGGATRAVGNFRDVSSPLREWLLRAAASNHAIVLADHAFFPNAETEDDPQLPELVPAGTREDEDWLAEYFEALDEDRLTHAITSPADAIALSAGLWQINDGLDRSHELSQSIEGMGRQRAGDYWHAINHRREPDYSNAKYWLRRVGRHPIHAILAQEVPAILETVQSPEAESWLGRLIMHDAWDAFAFVDLCQSAASQSDRNLSQAARQIQLLEMTLLLASTYDDATKEPRTQ